MGTPELPAGSRSASHAAREADAAHETDAARDELEAERERVKLELRDGIVAPDTMTYGSQAAAASQVFTQQRDLALREHNEQHLEAVEAALARIAEGTYGRCTSCGKPIATERLAARPWAPLCIDCQRAAGGSRRR